MLNSKTCISELKTAHFRLTGEAYLKDIVNQLDATLLEKYCHLPCLKNLDDF